MRVLLQRVAWARVRVAGEVRGEIGRGLCAFVAVGHGDTVATAARLARRAWQLRVFDEEGVMSASASERDAEVLVVSQFTLYGDTRRGRRPSWSAAAPAEVAEPLVEAFVAALSDLGARTASGVFRARMEVELCNEGPVTVLLEG